MKTRVGSFRDGGQSQPVGLVLGLFTFVPDLNLEGHGLPAAGSYLAYPWSLRIKPT